MNACYGTYLAHESGREAPRCRRCDHELKDTEYGRSCCDLCTQPMTSVLPFDIEEGTHAMIMDVGKTYAATLGQLFDEDITLPDAVRAICRWWPGMTIAQRNEAVTFSQQLRAAGMTEQADEILRAGLGLE